MNYKYIIWDVDGTLMDAGEGVILSIKQVLLNHGYCNFTQEQLIAMHAEPLIQKAFQNFCSLTDAEALSYANEFREIYKRDNLFKATLYPGIVDVLSHFKNQGIAQAIATNKRHDYAYDVCHHFGITHYCDPIIGSDGAFGTNKYHILERCLRELNVSDTCQVVMIGDTMGDKKAADDIGIGFVGVNYGYGFREVEGYANSPMEILTKMGNSQASRNS